MTITVHDAGDNTVWGATVTGAWSAGASGSSSCTTDGAGQCSVSKNLNAKKASSVTFTVANITGTNLWYDSAVNTAAIEITVFK